MKKTLKRICPSCGKELIYKSYYGFSVAEKNNSKCRSCTSSIRMQGENNPFYGKKHTEETKEKIRNKWKEPNHRKKILDYHKSEKRKEAIKKTTGQKNGRFGKSLYDCWLEKDGKEIADEKLKNWKEKQRIKSSGNNNPMFGKPSPQKAGNGYSGWYNNWFFRSLHELNYMVNIIERFNLNWKSAESTTYKVKYRDYRNFDSTYFADFIVEDKFMVEVKPKKLWNTPRIIAKKEAAMLFCENNNLKYKLVDVGKISFNQFAKLINEKKVILTEKTKERFKKWEDKHE